MVNKRILQIIAIIALFIPTYLAIYNVSVVTSDKLTAENTTKVIVELPGGTVREYDKKADIDSYTKIVNNAAEITSTLHDTDTETPVYFKFYKGKNELIYKLYLSLNSNDCVFIAPDEKLYHIKQSDADNLLNTSVSDYLYVNSKIPNLKYTDVGESIIIYPKKEESVWFLQKKDSVFSESTVLTAYQDTNSLDISQTSDYVFKFDTEPDVSEIIVTDNNNKIIFQDLYSNINLFSYDENAKLKFTVKAEWLQNEMYDYYGEAVYNIDVNYVVPINFTLSSIEANSGDIILITAKNAREDDEIVLNIDDEDIEYDAKFIYNNNSKIALVPIAMAFEGKTFNLSLNSSYSSTPTVFQLQVNKSAIVNKNYGAQDETLERNRKETPLKQRDDEYKKIYENYHDGKIWVGEFIMPCQGNIANRYGNYITINGSYGERCTGIDISSVTGTPVYASNSGKVVYTGELPDIGKLVVIEHGYGIKTWYGHLESYGTNVGDMVEKGQEIGKVGTTGTFTNLYAHLRFAVSIKNIFINPDAVIENGIPGFDYNISTPVENNVDDVLSENTGGETENGDIPVPELNID